jgi:hypothetical protein
VGLGNPTARSFFASIQFNDEQMSGVIGRICQHIQAVPAAVWIDDGHGAPSAHEKQYSPEANKRRNLQIDRHRLSHRKDPLLPSFRLMQPTEHTQVVVLRGFFGCVVAQLAYRDF